MSLRIVEKNIFEIETDCIVNPTDNYLSGSGSIDARIHQAGGKQLYDYLAKKEMTRYDEADIVSTPGFGLNYKYILHTVVPVYDGSKYDWFCLKSCFQNALFLAYKLKCKSIALPLIGTGACGFNKDKVIQLALDVINIFLLDFNINVYLVVYSKNIFSLSYEISNLDILLSDKFEHEFKSKLKNLRLFSYNENPLLINPKGKIYVNNQTINAADLKRIEIEINSKPKKSFPKDLKIDEAKLKVELKQIIRGKEISFATKLLDLICEYGFSESSVYHAAQILKATYYSMISNDSKPTYDNALKYAIVLPLKLTEVDELLASAGYTMNLSKKKEKVIRRIMELKEANNFKDLYNLFQLNEILYDLGLETL